MTTSLYDLLDTDGDRPFWRKHPWLSLGYVLVVTSLTAASLLLDLLGRVEDPRLRSVLLYAVAGVTDLFVILVLAVKNHDIAEENRYLRIDVVLLLKKIPRIQKVKFLQISNWLREGKYGIYEYLLFRDMDD